MDYFKDWSMKISSTKCTGKLKTSSTLGNVLVGNNKTPKQVKIGSFTKGSNPTIPGKINRTWVAITIDNNIGVEVSVLRRELLRPKDLTTIPERIRLKTVTGESTPIMGEAEVEICIGQLKIKHRALVANIEDDSILGMDFVAAQ